MVSTSLSYRSHLIVGGNGAVGSVYASGLLKAGCEVGLFLKEKHVAAWTRGGTWVHNIAPSFKKTMITRIALILTCLLLCWSCEWLGCIDKSWLLRAGSLAIGCALCLLHRSVEQPESFHVNIENVTVCASPRDVQQHRWDYVWLCISSTQLMEGDGRWLEVLMGSLPLHCCIVLMTPGPNDMQFVQSLFDDMDRIVQGVISMASFRAPLVDESFRAVPAFALEKKGTHIAYFVPPGSPSFFKGPAKYVAPIVRDLCKGGVAAASSSLLTAQHHVSVKGPCLVVMIAALEASGWRFGSLCWNSPLLQLSCDAMKEMVRINYCVNIKEVPPRVGLWLLRPVVMRLILLLAPRMTPFDLEAFFGYHFRKVGDQMHYLFNDAISQAQAAVPKIPCDNLMALRDVLRKQAN